MSGNTSQPTLARKTYLTEALIMGKNHGQINDLLSYCGPQEISSQFITFSRKLSHQVEHRAAHLIDKIETSHTLRSMVIDQATNRRQTILRFFVRAAKNS